MKNKLFNLAVKVTTAGMILSMFASALPASAAVAVPRSTSLDTLKAATPAVATVTFTAREVITGDDTTPPKLRVSFADWTGITAMTPTDWTVTIAAGLQTEEPLTTGVCTAGAGPQVAYDDTSDTALTISFCTGSGAISSGTVIVVTVGGTVNKLTNPATGSHEVALSCTAVCAVTGSMFVPIMDDDSVSVTASVAATLTFDIDISVGAPCSSNSSPTYSVPLSTLSTTAITIGGDHICLDVSTNADGGAIIEVKDLNSGLKSASANSGAGYTVTTAPGALITTLVAGTEGYGLCIQDINVATTVPASVITGDPSFVDLAACTTKAGGLTSTWAELANTNSNPATGTANASIDMVLLASAAPTTPAASDYADTLYFRATATY